MVFLSLGVVAEVYPHSPLLLQSETGCFRAETLERGGWNHSRAAEALGIARTTLWRKLQDYGLDRRDAKER
jgi:transcriptional regulator of acetoin/glycerol metabolism